MAYFGKLVAPREERRRLEPIKMPTYDTSAILKQFELTLAGRVLNLEAQAHRVKALLAFIPTIWKCETRVHGLDLGRGRFHFRFQKVLDKRTYHFDG